MFDYCVIGNTKTMVDKVPLKKKERERDFKFQKPNNQRDTEKKIMAMSNN